MERSIRTLKVSDCESVAELSLQLGYPGTPAGTARRLSFILQHPDHCAFGITERDQVIGWIHAFRSVHLESDPFIEIGGLVIDHHYRNQGLGQLLVQRIIAWAASLDISSIRVRSNIIRTEAHRFYLRMGFVERKEQKVFALEAGK